MRLDYSCHRAPLLVESGGILALLACLSACNEGHKARLNYIRHHRGQHLRYTQPNFYVVTLSSLPSFHCDVNLLPAWRSMYLVIDKCVHDRNTRTGVSSIETLPDSSMRSVLLSKIVPVVCTMCGFQRLLFRDAHVIAEVRYLACRVFYDS